ncbi:MAG: HD domain-containing phosphohydrolase [Acidobacteriota bacterium]|nr:HD domain-containing phosphohydrolase [Acidobacteriota bacterium]MDQ7087392.1 HD domain-containing phosphohydrolase [Acidobacteriota bacterium]
MPAAADTAQYILVPIEHLRAETVLSFDLFIQHEGTEPVLYRARDMEFTGEVRQRLLESGVHELLVPADQAEAYQQYCAEQGQTAPQPAKPSAPEVSEEELRLTELVLDAGLPLESRCSTLLGVSRMVVEAVLSDLASPGLHQRVQRVAEAGARLLLAEPEAYSRLVSRFGIDFEVAGHLANTSFYVTEFARAIGTEDVQELASLGRAALLHDVGKGDTPGELLHRDSGLTDLEWAEVMSHPERGVTMLREAGWDDPLCLDVCANHHERCDGSGYPRGLHREQISLAARMVAIADTFDSLTSGYTNRPAYSGFQALWRMKREMVGKFDADLLDRFIQVMVDPALRR